MAQLLLEARAKVDAKDYVTAPCALASLTVIPVILAGQFGYTPLYYAVISKHCRVAEVLLAGGADAGMSDYVSAHLAPFVLLIWALGRTQNGQTALDRATQLKHEAMVKVMESAASKKRLSAGSWFHRAR